MAKKSGKGRSGTLPVTTDLAAPQGIGGKFATEALLTQEINAEHGRTPEEMLSQQAEVMSAHAGVIFSPADTVPGGAGTALTPSALVAEATMTLWGDVWRRLRKNRLAILGLGIIIFLVLVATLAPLIAPYGVGQGDLNLPLAQSCRGPCPPSLKHWFGTDVLGRDYFSLVVHGARTSVVIGLASVVLSLVIGLPLGAIAGYYGKKADGIIMRLADVFFAYPFILGAIVIITVFGEGFPRLAGLIFAIGILGWATVARLLRASVLQVRNTEYVEAARALGAENRRMLTRHVIPNALAPVIVFSTIATGGVILTEAALSFLGLGLPPGSAAWGLLVSEGKSHMTNAPWLVIFPGLAIMFTVMGFIFLGDGLRDSMDPRLR
jgi:ABC-type dipeptide/oligopeptide/nickel transport system permease subunit